MITTPWVFQLIANFPALLALAQKLGLPLSSVIAGIMDCGTNWACWQILLTEPF